MLYVPFLESLLASVKGAQAALLLDSEGEVVVQAGEKEFRHRLIGAYEGISLATINEIMARHDMGALRYLRRRHQGGHVVLRPLKDGYYFVVCLGPDANVALAVHRSLATQQALEAEL